MAVTKSRTIACSVDGGGSSLSSSNTYSGTLEKSISEDVATAETDLNILFTLDVSAVTFCYIHSTEDVTIETNAVDATGGDTLTMVAGVPYIWHTDSYDSFLLTTDILVAGVFVTNASGSTATVSFEFITDATP